MEFPGNQQGFIPDSPDSPDHPPPLPGEIIYPPSFYSPSSQTSHSSSLSRPSSSPSTHASSFSTRSASNSP